MRVPALTSPEIRVHDPSRNPALYRSSRKGNPLRGKDHHLTTRLTNFQAACRMVCTVATASPSIQCQGANREKLQWGSPKFPLVAWWMALVWNRMTCLPALTRM